MTESFIEIKRKSLESRRDALLEEYNAAFSQLNSTLSAIDQVKLRRQLEHLEAEICKVEAEIAELIAAISPVVVPLAAPQKGQPGPSDGGLPVFGAGKGWAVLAGVNAYDDNYNYGSLSVCASDAQAIQKALVAGGFDAGRIHLLTDEIGKPPTRANIIGALESVANATERDDLLLFYYSGHGDEFDDQSYLVARDGQHVALKYTGLSVALVEEIMKAAPARAKVIILDACHSGADFGGKGPIPMSPKFIQRVFEQAQGMAVLASCQQGQLSYVWKEQQCSAFTHYLLEALRGNADYSDKGFVSVQDANLYLVNNVVLWASQRGISQRPTLTYNVSGDIILTRQRA